MDNDIIFVIVAAFGIAGGIVLLIKARASEPAEEKSMARLRRGAIQMIIASALLILFIVVTRLIS